MKEDFIYPLNVIIIFYPRKWREGKNILHTYIKFHWISLKKKYFHIIDSMLSKQNLIKNFSFKKNNKCVQMLFATIVDTILNVTQSRERNQSKKYILNFSFSRKNIFVYREIFSPQDRKIEKKRENLFPREIFISQNRKKLCHFTKDETTNISNAINVTRKFLST